MSLIFAGTAAALQPGVAKIDITARYRSPTSSVLFNKRITTRPIGVSTTHCEGLADDVRLCHTIYRFPLGVIVTAGIRTSTVYHRAAVVGGTGFYDNVGGEVIVQTLDLSPRRERLKFTLRAY